MLADLFALALTALLFDAAIALLFWTGWNWRFFDAAIGHGVADLLDLVDDVVGEFALEIIGEFLHHFVGVLHGAADDAALLLRLGRCCWLGLLLLLLRRWCVLLGCGTHRRILRLRCLRRGLLRLLRWYVSLLLRYVGLRLYGWLLVLLRLRLLCDGLRRGLLLNRWLILLRLRRCHFLWCWMLLCGGMRGVLRLRLLL